MKLTYLDQDIECIDVAGAGEAIRVFAVLPAIQDWASVRHEFRLIPTNSAEREIIDGMTVNDFVRSEMYGEPPKALIGLRFARGPAGNSVTNISNDNLREKAGKSGLRIGEVLPSAKFML